MDTIRSLPKLITFDGEARSGKGTIVQATKDFLRDECGYKVMLIDAGQVFRVLVLAITRAGVGIDDPEAIDQFLRESKNIESSVELVKKVYRMPKSERDALLYTSEVGRNSAKVGARPLSQEFKDSLLQKWLQDARNEGFEVVLLDGRALDETGLMLENEGLCKFAAHLYFVSDPVVGARRTLGFAGVPYDELGDTEKASVDELVEQIVERNEADRTRTVQPITPPRGAPRVHLPDELPIDQTLQRPSVVVDTSQDMAIDEMTRPVELFVQGVLTS